MIAREGAPRRRRGVALMLVLWLVVVLGALTAATAAPIW
jgi:Tfp pilus assembly protein PilX